MKYKYTYKHKLAMTVASKEMIVAFGGIKPRDAMLITKEMELFRTKRALCLLSSGLGRYGLSGKH